jgi:hypothetical protein
MNEFIIGVLASLVAGLLLLGGTALASQRARWLLTGLLGRLLDIDVEAVFADKQASETDLHAELERANNVSILTGRGNELQRNAFDPLFMRRPSNSSVKVRLLLPDTERRPGHVDWIWQRETELSGFDPAFGKGLLRKQIDGNVAFLQPYIKAGQLELRRFNSPHIGRIVLTDRFAYFTPYQSSSHGRHNPVYKYRRGSVYDNLERLFRQLWKASDYSLDSDPSAELKGV